MTKNPFRRLCPPLAILFALLMPLAACDSRSADVPEWFPVYPGSEPAMLSSRVEGDRRFGSFSFEADEPPGPVLVFYRDALEGKGYEVRTSPFERPDEVRGGQLTAKTADGAHGLHVTVDETDAGSSVVVSYSELL